jgi:hypothetical protein
MAVGPQDRAAAFRQGLEAVHRPGPVAECPQARVAACPQARAEASQLARAVVSRLVLGAGFPQDRVVACRLDQEAASPQDPAAAFRPVRHLAICLSRLGTSSFRNWNDAGSTSMRISFAKCARTCSSELWLPGRWHPSGRGLTLRSSGLPPAGHLGRETARVIIRLAAQARCRRQPLSSLSVQTGTLR